MPSNGTVTGSMVNTTNGLKNSFFFFWPPHGIWTSWTRGQIRAAIATYATAVAMLDPLTFCVRLGIEPASWYCRDATYPLVPQWGLLNSNFNVLSKSQG